MSLLTSLLILIIFARVFGEILRKLNQPAIVGEMLAGVLLGPNLLNIVKVSPALSGISELASFLVVLSAGLEMNFKDVTSTIFSKGVVISILAFAIPFAGGLGVGYTFGLDVSRMIFLGLCVSITALPVAIRILQSFSLLNSDIARYSIATAIFNDVIALLAVGIVMSLPSQGSFQSVAVSVLVTGTKLLLLCAVVILINYFFQKLEGKGVHIEKYLKRIFDVIGTEALFGLVIIFVLIFGSLTEALGFHFVIGAFFGALLIDKKFFLASRYSDLTKSVSSITDGFLAPVFFAYLGLLFNSKSIPSYDFVVAVLMVSIVTKIFAGWLGGKLIGVSSHESIGIGIILNGRGIMELVIASIAYERGFIDQGLFSTLVLMGVVTTMITPIFFRRWVMPKMKRV